MKSNDIVTIEKKLGYAFKNKALLERAFTHSSVTRDAQKNYESLEFLGDSILDFVVAKRLMEENPDAHEGALTHRRAEIVSQEPLEKAVDRLGIAAFLIVGKGENVDNITLHTKVKSNMFEAVVGAIYLDSGSMDEAERFILSKLRDHFDGSYKHGDSKDFKTELNEYASKRKIKVKYRLVEQTGASHDPRFTVEVSLDGKAMGKGTASSKKGAEQLAASEAIASVNAK